MTEFPLYTLSSPIVQLALAGACIIFILLLLAVRASLRVAKLTEPLAHQMGALGQRIQALGEG
jgi:DNA recombination protein RmuC